MSSRGIAALLALSPLVWAACAATESPVGPGGSDGGAEGGFGGGTATDGGEPDAGSQEGTDGNAPGDDSGIQGDEAGSVDAASYADGSGIDAGSEAGSVDGASEAGRDPTLQPFSSTGVWNLPIGSGAQWGASGDPDVEQLVNTKEDILAEEYGKPFYVGTSSDPLVTLKTTDDFYKVPTQQLHVPADASFTLWMDMFDRTQPRYFWSSYNCSFINDKNVTGGVRCSYTAVTDVCSDGVTSLHGADRYDWGIGTIRHWELEAGEIRHTLRYAVSLDVVKSAGPVWNQDVPWPDDNEDYDGPTAYKGDLVFGSTIGIPASVDISTLHLSAGGLVLARALQDHGAIMRDTTGGSGRLVFYAEPQDENSPVIHQMRGDLAKITPLLRVMRNQGPTSVNGGGTPRAALVPPIDTSICH